MNYGIGTQHATMESLLPCSNQLIKKAKKNLGKLLWLWEIDNSVYALVKGSGEAIHSINIDQDGNSICSCENETYRSSLVCKHLLIVLYQLGEKKAIEAIDRIFYKDKEKEEYKMDDGYYLPCSNLKAINELIGGLPIGTGLMICGWHATGKSIAIMHMLFEVINYYLTQNKIVNALIIDTEGNRHSYDAWFEELRTRYELKDMQIVEILVDFKPLKEDKNKSGIALIGSIPKAYDETKSTLFFMDVRGITKLIALSGRQCRVEISEETANTKGGKITLVPVKHGWVFNAIDSPIGMFCKDRNVKFIGIDSISTPLLEFGTDAMQGNPARASATNYWLLPLEQLSKTLNLVFVGSAHLTKQPDSPYARADHFGGKHMGHIHKFVFELKKFEKKELANVRELVVERAPRVADRSKSRRLDLTDVGFLDHVEKGK